MKIYEQILDNLIGKARVNSDLCNRLLIYLDHWLVSPQKYKKEITVNAEIIEKAFPAISDQYRHFILSHYCPILGALDMYVPYADQEGENCAILFNYEQTKDEFPTLLPIGNIDGGEYLFLNEKGQVIQFVGISRKEAPEDFFTEVPDDEYETGFDIAYLTYPDSDGLYRMYKVIARSFDEFMNDYVFGEGYLDLVEKKDDFYCVVKNIRKTMGIESSWHKPDTSWGKQIRESLKSAPEGAEVNIDFKIKETDENT